MVLIQKGVGGEELAATHLPAEAIVSGVLGEWIDAAAMPRSESGIREMVQSYARAGINVLFPETICRGYFFNIPCARMIGGFPKRYEQIQTLMAQYQAKGVIFQRIKFCDPWGGEAHKMLHRKKTTGLHLLVLDREYGVISTGQIKTRVQAFLETMGK